MKIALCYSTQIRTGINAFPEHERMFMGVDYDVFIHCWDVNTHKIFPNHVEKVPSEVLNQYFDLLKPKKKLIESSAEKYYYADALMYSWYRSVKLKQEWEKQTGVRYDAVVKMRPDLIFEPDWSIIPDIKIAIKENAFLIDGLMPQWKEPLAYCEDVLWIASNNVMDFSTTYYEYNMSGLNHKQVSLAKYLDQNHVHVKSTVGENSPRWHYSVLRPETLCIDMDENTYLKNRIIDECYVAKDNGKHDIIRNYEKAYNTKITFKPNYYE